MGGEGEGWLAIETWSEDASFPMMTVLFFSLLSQQAVEVMCFVPKRCNDMMTLGRLRGFEVQGWSNALLPQAEHSGDPYRELCSPGADRRWLVGSVRGRREEQRVAPFLLLFFSKAILLWFQGKLTAQGKLLGQDTFWVTEPEAGGLLSSRGRERRVFLFEQIIIFSEALGGVRGGTQPGYVYKSSIKVGRVSRGRGLTGLGEASERMEASQILLDLLEGTGTREGLKNLGATSYLPIQVSCLGLEGNLQGDPCRFALTSRGPEGVIQRYVLQTADPAVSQAWIKQVAQILESQRDFLNGEALTLPPRHPPLVLGSPESLTAQSPIPALTPASPHPSSSLFHC